MSRGFSCLAPKSSRRPSKYHLFVPDATRPVTPEKLHPVVHAITSNWRRLTGGKSVRDADRRTLLACSAGADSSALVLAFATQPASVVVAHIVHDMRPETDSAKCLEAARFLADSLGVHFDSERIEAKPAGGNYEAAARARRYAALEKIALRHGCRFIATAHHAEDQLETILLRLIRGTGPKGLASIRAKRTLPGGLTVVRPMLPLSREQARHLCTDCAWKWSEDASNADLSHKRAALRAAVLPGLLQIEPRAALRAVDAARLSLLAADHLGRAAGELALAAKTADPERFDRSVLRSADRIVLLTWLYTLKTSAPLRVLESIAGAIRSKSGEPRAWSVGPCTFRLERDRLCVLRK